MSKCPLGYSNILAWVVKEYHRIGAFKMSTSKKNERMQKVAIQAVSNLWVKVADTKPVKEVDKYHEPKDEHVTATTHNRYLTRLRRDLEEAGLFDYDFESNIEALIDEYPKRKDSLEKLKTSTYKQADKARNELVKSLKASLKKSKREATVNELKTLIEKLSTLSIEHILYVELSRTKKEKRDMNHRESDRKAKYQKRPRKFSGLDMIETIYRLIKTDKPENLAIACAMACGRRCAEVLHFAQLDKFNDTRLTFTGMRKSKVKATETFKIPVIIEPELFLEALNKLRDSDFIAPTVRRLKREKLHEAELARRLNGLVSGRLNERINSEFNRGIPEDKHIKWTFKDTRAIYARLSYAIYCANMKKASKEPVQEIEYFKNTLLHTDHNETLNYLQFRLTDAEVLTAYNIKKAKKAADELEFVPQQDLIRPLLKNKVVQENGTMARVVPMLVEWLTKNGEQNIDTSFLRNQFGGNRTALTALLGLIRDAQAHEPRLVVKEVKKSTKKMITKRIEVTTVYTFTKREMVEVQLKEGATDDQWQTALDNAAENASEYSYDSFSVYDADEMETDWELDDEWTDELDDSDE
ncbi:protelomerase family protein [Acinetobacter sp. LMB-5]|uniref:protelomerase family protein n=1 Tax=Acinetobacter sp. LMB-5 TaxID=1609919 RepID=UPI0007615EC2|nr:protelomerase family protein [Acinetobacter sp. LMB-5]